MGNLQTGKQEQFLKPEINKYSSSQVDSCVAKTHIDEIWNELKKLNLQNLFPDQIKSAKITEWPNLEILNNDNSIQQVRVVQQSSSNFSVSYETINSVPHQETYSVFNNFKLTEISDEGWTHFEWETVFSSDVTPEILTKYSFFKLSCFRSLKERINKQNQIKQERKKINDRSTFQVHTGIVKTDIDTIWTYLKTCNLQKLYPNTYAFIDSSSWPIIKFKLADGSSHQAIVQEVSSEKKLITYQVIDSINFGIASVVHSIKLMEVSDLNHTFFQQETELSSDVKQADLDYYLEMKKNRLKKLQENAIFLKQQTFQMHNSIVLESCVIEEELHKAWFEIKHLNLQNLFPGHFKAVDTKNWPSVTIYTQDGGQQLAQVQEQSVHKDLHFISYSIISSVPQSQYSAAQHKLSILPITDTEEQGKQFFCYLEWETEFSSDAKIKVIEEERMAKLNCFKSLKKSLAQKHLLKEVKSSLQIESCIVNERLPVIWNILKTLNFSALFSDTVFKVDTSQWPVAKIFYQDDSVWTVKIIEQSSTQNRFITYEVIETQPLVYFSASLNKISLIPVTDEQKTYIQWETEFANDVSRSVIEDNKYKKLENFYSLQKQIFKKKIKKEIVTSQIDIQSAIVNQPIQQICQELKLLNLQKVFPSLIKSVDRTKWPFVQIYYQDKSVWNVQVREQSFYNNYSGYITYEVINANPSLSYSSAIHKIEIIKVSDEDRTFIQWETEFSNDATYEVLADSKYKKLESFKNKQFKTQKNGDVAFNPAFNTVQIESCIVDISPDQIWRHLKVLKFEVLFPGSIRSTYQQTDDMRNQINGSLVIEFKDGSNWTISVKELSLRNKYVSYEVIECNPAVQFSSSFNKISIQEVTDAKQTYIQWETEFANDVSLQIIEDNKYKKQDCFQSLKKQFQKKEEKKKDKAENKEKTLNSISNPIQIESCVLKNDIDSVWQELKNLNLQNLFPQLVKSVKINQWPNLEIIYQDEQVHQVIVLEQSAHDHFISYQVVDSNFDKVNLNFLKYDFQKDENFLIPIDTIRPKPSKQELEQLKLSYYQQFVDPKFKWCDQDAKVNSIIHKLQLIEVTETKWSYLQWETEFSNDVKPEMIKSSKKKKLENFALLKKFLDKLESREKLSNTTSTINTVSSIIKVDAGLIWKFVQKYAFDQLFPYQFLQSIINKGYLVLVGRQGKPIYAQILEISSQHRYLSYQIIAQESQECFSIIHKHRIIPVTDQNYTFYEWETEFSNDVTPKIFEEHTEMKKIAFDDLSYLVPLLNTKLIDVAQNISYQTSFVKAPMMNLWNDLKNLNFAKLFPKIIADVDISQWPIVVFYYKDNIVKTVKVEEQSQNEDTCFISYSKVSSIPDDSYATVLNKIRLSNVKNDRKRCIFEWESEFSQDAKAAIVKNSTKNKLIYFQNLDEVLKSQNEMKNICQSNQVESCIVNKEIVSIWKDLSRLQFQKLFLDQINIVNTDEWPIVKIHHLDQTIWTVMVLQQKKTLDKYSISYQLIDSKPRFYFASSINTITLLPVSDRNQTYMEWETEYSSDAKEDVLKDNKHKKFEFFYSLQKQFFKEKQIKQSAQFDTVNVQSCIVNVSFESIWGDLKKMNLQKLFPDWVESVDTSNWPLISVKFLKNKKKSHQVQYNVVEQSNHDSFYAYTSFELVQSSTKQKFSSCLEKISIQAVTDQTQSYQTFCQWESEFSNDIQFATWQKKKERKLKMLKNLQNSKITKTPTKTVQIESCVVKADTNLIWKHLSIMKLQVLFPDFVESTYYQKGWYNELSSNLEVKFKDKSEWVIKINELSSYNKYVSYELISSSDKHKFTAAFNKISLQLVTDGNYTYVEWETEFSNDADIEVIEDNKFKKLECFSSLKKQFEE